MSTGALSERAMLASLTIHRYAGTLTDKKVTRDVAAQHQVKAKRAGHYRKHAIDVDAPSFKAVSQAATKVRELHYWHTLPWSEGARILTAQNFERYAKEIRTASAEFDEAADAFAADFPRLHENAKLELNGLYNPADYPTNVRAKFGIERQIMPLPAADDFRVKLNDTDVAAIRAGITDEVERSIAQAQREPYERLYEHVKRMAERLSDPEAIFRDSLVTGLADIIDIMPALNLTGDAKLEELRAKAQTLITGIDANMLRTVPSVRANVAHKAQEIQDAMAGFFPVGGAS